MNSISELALQTPSNIAVNPPANSNSKLGQEDFLQLLVAQMKNQDPTKPVDNFQFLSQIAQFGMVDGIQELQTSFGSVADSFKQSQLLQSSSLLDRNVLTESDIASFSASNNIRGSVNIPDQASEIIVEIRSSDGILVETLQLGNSSGGEVTFEWDGVGSDGNLMPHGQYFVHAKGLKGGELKDFLVNTLNRVKSVVIDELARVSLTLTTGEVVDLAVIKEIQ